MKTKLPLYIKALLALVIFFVPQIYLNSFGQIGMTIGGSNSQNFNGLPVLGGIWQDNKTISGWYWQESLGFATFTGNDGTSQPTMTTRYSYRTTVAQNPDNAIGGISTASNGIAMGMQLVNNSSAPIEEIKVSYTGEQWHFGGTSLTSKITFWYKVSKSVISDLTPGVNNGWTAVTALDFTSPIAYDGDPGALDGNASANRKVFSNIAIPNLNVPSGYYIMLRWSYADQGTFHGLAIDDVNISWIGNTVSKGGNWTSGVNWDMGMPDVNTNAIINGAVTADITTSCYNLTINSGKSLTINSTTTLTVNKNFLIKSSASGVGSYINYGIINILGSPSVEMYVPATTIHNGIYFSPPLNAINAPTLSELVYRYNATTCTWVLVYGRLNVGTGYTVRSDNPITITTNGGSLNNAAVNISGMVRQASPNNYGWNLVGNPFVCGMDWEVLNNNAANFTNLTDGFYIRKSDGTIASYVNGVGNPAGTSSIIPPFQAFYAQVLITSTTGTLTIPLNARTHNTSNFYKNTIPIIRLQISSNEGYSDETVIRIDDNATEKLDNEYDGTKMFAENDINPQIFSLSSDKDELCVNAISVNENKIITIPIGFKTNNDGAYTLNAFDYTNVDKSISIFIKDNQTNTLQDLRKNPSYTFNSSTTFNTERFVLLISKQSSGISTNSNNSKVLISSVNKTVIIDLQGEPNAKVEIYNVLGELILNKLLNNSSLQKIDLSVNEGIYVVKVYTNNYSVAKKVMIK